MTNTSALLELDRQRVFHASTHLKQYAHGEAAGRVITGGKGIRITDSDGVELLDGFAGLYCVNIGYGRDEINHALARQGKALSYYHTYVGHTTEALIELSDRIIRIAPDGMSKVFYGTSGSDANETQMKLVWYFNNVLGREKKKKIISRHRGYHGSTVAAGSLTGLPLFHDHFDLPMERVKHTITPSYYHRDDPDMSEEEFSSYCAIELEQLIMNEDPDTVAAFIAEPVLGTGGIIPPPAAYWEKIQPILQRYDVLLIADEVVCGFGRLGAAFGSLYYDIKPDLITVGKGLTSAYLPLSGVIVGDRVWEVLEQGTDAWGGFGHGYTYSGHPLCAAAAIENLNIIEREDLTGNAARTGFYFQEKLRKTFEGHPLVGDVRGVGLLAAIEFAANRTTRERFDPNTKVGPKVSAACLEEGLIARAMPHGDILGFAPPLVVSRDDIDDIVDRTERAVNRVASDLIAAGDWKRS